jgi:hypothetical protein
VEQAGQRGRRPKQEPDCVLVVDSGFSFTHIVPFYQVLLSVLRLHDCHSKHHRKTASSSAAAAAAALD